MRPESYKETIGYLASAWSDPNRKTVFSVREIRGHKVMITTELPEGVDKSETVPFFKEEIIGLILKAGKDASPDDLIKLIKAEATRQASDFVYVLDKNVTI